MSRQRIALDLPDITAFQTRPARAEADPREVARVSEEAGFRTRHDLIAAENVSTIPARHDQPKFDARTLRRSKRKAQLNIATQQEVRDRFWAIAQELEVTSGEEVLLVLLEAYDTTRS